MILIAFNNYKIKTVIKNLIMLYLTTLVFGGTSFMLIFADPKKIIFEARTFYWDVSYTDGFVRRDYKSYINIYCSQIYKK